MTRLLLLRHAQHDLVGRALAGRMDGVAINAQGRLQAQALASSLVAWPIHAIACSPRERTRETVGPFAERVGLPVELAPEFDEVDVGQWAGLTFAEVQRRDPRAWEAWVHRRSSAHPPGGEAFADVRVRAMAGVERLRRAHPQGTVLVVSHGDVIKCVLATVLCMSLDDLERFEIACASISEVEAGADWMKVIGVNRPMA